jgi:4-amino-4-deoxy-L-arabinose transferase-like glycosyltransferase
MRQRKQLYVIASLIGIGLLLRLPNLFKLGLWRDEGSTYFDALPLEWSEVIKTVIYSELNPPAFFIVMHQWMQWFGAEEVVFKLPALFFGLLLIPAIYWLGCTAYSKKTGVLASAIATFAPDAIYFSQEARPYTLTVLLCCLVATFYFKLLEKPKHRLTQIGFIICGALLLYTQYTGALLIISLGITTLYLWQRRKITTIVPFVVGFGVIAALFLPWLPVFLNHLAVGSPWAPKFSWLYRPVIMLSQLLYTLLIPTAGSFFTVTALSIALVLGIQKQRNPRPSFPKNGRSLNPATVILGLNVVLPAMMLAILSYDTYRYMLAFSPLAWVIYAQGLKHLLYRVDRVGKGSQKILQQNIIWGTLIFFAIVPSTIDAFSPGITAKSGLREMALALKAQPQDKTIYLLNPDFFGPTFGYYFAKTNAKVYGFARWNHPELFSPRGYAEAWDSPNLLGDTMENIEAEAKKGYQTLLLIQTKRHMDDGGKVRYSRTNELLTQIQAHYPQLSKKEYQARNEPVTLYSFKIMPR